MSADSDEQLLSNYGQNGDLTAFEQLYHRYRQPLFAYIRQKLPEASCNEVFQEVWLSVIEYAQQEQASQAPSLPHRFKALLYTMARRRIADYYRRTPQNTSLDQSEALSAANNVEHDYQIEQQQRTILYCVSLLPKQQQEVFQLKQAGLKVSEIGESLESSFDAVKSRIRSAYKQLRACWEKHHG